MKRKMVLVVEGARSPPDSQKGKGNLANRYHQDGERTQIIRYIQIVEGNTMNTVIYNRYRSQPPKNSQNNKSPPAILKTEIFWQGAKSFVWFK